VTEEKPKRRSIINGVAGRREPTEPLDVEKLARGLQKNSEDIPRHE
jgi:hypothetical protein